MPGPHDMGGQPAGPMDFSEQIFGDFEQGADALIMLLAGGGRRVIRVDELRRAIESLPKERYLSLAYYEKWIQAVKLLMVEKGVLTEEEIAAREEEIRRRLAAGDSGA